MENNTNVNTFIGYVSYVMAAIFVGIGFHKIHVYENSDSYYTENVNAYVGGDAYNYIINAGLATAYFALATAFIILGSAMLIIKAIKKPKTDKIIEIKQEQEETI